MSVNIDGSTQKNADSQGFMNLLIKYSEKRLFSV